MLVKYAPGDRRKAISDEVKSMEETWKDPIARNQLTDPDTFKKLMNNRREELDRITPPDISGDERVKLQQRTDQLSTAFTLGNRNAVCGMPSEIDMEKCTVGAEGRHIEHEQFWKNHNLAPDGTTIVRCRKDKNNRKLDPSLIDELKNNGYILGKEREGFDPDVANLEKFRPRNVVPSLADTPLPVTYAPNARLSYSQHVTQYPDYVPTKAAVQGGLYPGFIYDSLTNSIVRTAEHPAFGRLGPECITEEKVGKRRGRPPKNPGG